MLGQAFRANRTLVASGFCEQAHDQGDAGAVDVEGSGWFNGSTNYTAPNLGRVGNMPNAGVSDAGTFVLAETSLDMHCWGENPVVTAKLQLNGQDRFSEREGTYFDLVQPYQHQQPVPPYYGSHQDA